MNYLEASNTSTKTKTASVSGLWLYALGTLFVVLKLTGTINWSWWFVLAPFWIPWVLIALGLMVMGLVALAFILVNINKR